MREKQNLKAKSVSKSMQRNSLKKMMKKHLAKHLLMRRYQTMKVIKMTGWSLKWSQEESPDEK